MRQNLIIRWTDEREKLLEKIREQLRVSGESIERIHGSPTNAAIFDEALKALEQKLAIEADDAKWDASFARSQDFLQELADEARAEEAAGLTEDFDTVADTDSV